jgi:hypothetical protein
VVRILRKTLKPNSELREKDNAEKLKTAQAFGMEAKVIDDLWRLTERPTFTYKFVRALMALNLPQIFAGGFTGLLVLLLFLFRLVLLVLDIPFSTGWVDTISIIGFGGIVLFAALTIVLVLIGKGFAKRKRCLSIRADAPLEEQLITQEILDHDPMPPFREKAKCIFETLKANGCAVKYVVMGHTHYADRQRLNTEGAEYLNTGTWITIFNREEELIRNPHTFPFVEIVGDEANLYQWDDTIGKPRELVLQEKERMHFSSFQTR